jgi:hypothetical protein
MNKKNILVSLLISFPVVFVFAFQSSEDPKILYEKAKYTMETKGDLQEAINIFKQIVDSGNAERSLRAKALFHIGFCNERLGNREAKKAYQEIIQNYGEQKETVAKARERLSQLNLMAMKIAKTALKPKFTKIKIPSELSWNAATSPDGQQLLLVYDEKLSIRKSGI